MQTLERISLGDQVRKAIRDSGRTIYDISIKTECNQGNLRSFMAGKRGLSLDVLERIVGELGLELRPTSVTK